MTGTESQKPLSIAIIGGGIAGLTLTIALLNKCHQFDVTLYESAAAFGEIGAGVGFQPVMVKTMGLIDPRIEDAFHNCHKGIKRAGPPKWFTVRVGDKRKIVHTRKEECVVLEPKDDKREVKLDEELFVIPAQQGSGGGVHRAHFLDELVKLVPDGIAQFRKRLVEVQEDDSDRVTLHFADGTIAQHDVVFGCDGIKSRTRAIVLGGSESSKAEFSGKYAYRGLIPMTKAVEILGADVPLESQMFVGYQGHVLTFPIANGKILNVVAFSSRPEWKEENWVVATSREEMLEDYKHWSPTVRALLENLQSTDVWALFDHSPAPEYYQVSPLICLVGDAAHASTPHQGSGAGMCIEDVYALSELLQNCTNRDQVAQAIRAYDAVRRPRTQKLVKTSREAGMLWDFEGEGIGDDLDAFQHNALSRMDWIWNYDIQKDLLEGKKMVHEN